MPTPICIYIYIYIVIELLHSSRDRPWASWPLGASTWSFPDVSQMPPRCLSDASSLNDFFSMILCSMIPPQGSLLYHRSSNESSSMIPLDWFLFHDSSNGFTKKLCLGSRAGVIFVYGIILGVIFVDLGGPLDDILVVRKLMQILIEKPGRTGIRQIPRNPEKSRDRGPDPLRTINKTSLGQQGPPEALHIVAEARWVVAEFTLHL